MSIFLYEIKIKCKRWYDASMPRCNGFLSICCRTASAAVAVQYTGRTGRKAYCGYNASTYIQHGLLLPLLLLLLMLLVPLPVLFWYQQPLLSSSASIPSFFNFRTISLWKVPIINFLNFSSFF